MAVPEVVVPVRGIGRNPDNDSPNYEFAPGLLLVVALAYDSLTGPDAVRDAGGVLSPDFTRMRPRLAVGWWEEENGDWIVDLRPAAAARSKPRSLWSAPAARHIGVPVRCGQRSEQIADAMTAVTASGWEISVRCDPPWKMVMWECARWAIESSEAAVMI